MFQPEEHMLDLKGKKYLQVMWRLVWFREVHPDWTICTEQVGSGADFSLFRAEIRDDTGRVLSTGHGSETRKDFGDYIEKAETKAVGRALAMLGYGTQFAPELDEGERIVDSPIQPTAARITDAQAADLRAALESVDGDEVKFCEVFKVEIGIAHV